MSTQAQADTLRGLLQLGWRKLPAPAEGQHPVVGGPQRVVSPGGDVAMIHPDGSVEAVVAETETNEGKA